MKQTRFELGAEHLKHINGSLNVGISPPIFSLPLHRLVKTAPYFDRY